MLIALYLLLVCLFGVLAIDLVAGKLLNGWQKIGLGYGAGVFLVTAQYFVAKLFFNLPERYLSLVLLIEALALAGFWVYQNGRPSFNPPKFDFQAGKTPLRFFSAAILVLMVVLSLATARDKSFLGYDALAQWSLGAKNIVALGDGAIVSPELIFPWHTNYPWLNPLFQAWLSQRNGAFNEFGLVYAFVCFYLALGLVIFGTLKKRSLDWALGLTAVYATMPLVFFHSHEPYSDLLLGFYVLSSVVLGYEWLKSGKAPLKYLSAIFLAAACFTKNEGAIFALAFILALTLVGFNLGARFWKTAATWLGAFLLAISFWWGYMFVNRLGLSNTAGGLGWHGEVWSTFLPALFINQSFNIWWYVLLIIIIIKRKAFFKSGPAALVNWTWLIAGLGIMAVFAFTGSYVDAVNGTALTRTLLPVTILSVLGAGLLFKDS